MIREKYTNTNNTNLAIEAFYKAWPTKYNQTSNYNLLPKPKGSQTIYTPYMIT